MTPHSLLDIYQHPDDYDLVHGKTSDDAAFWLELCDRLKPASVLELGVGTGRLLLPLVRAGYRVTGLDVVPAMLQSAAGKLKQEPEAVQALAQLVEQDMRSMSLDRQFDLTFIGYNSVLHLLTAGDRCLLFTGALGHTAPGGHFAVDVFNPDLAMLALAQRIESRGELEMAMDDPDTGRQVFRSASHRYNDASQTVTTHYVTDETIRGVEQQPVEETVDYHIYYPEELRLLFLQAGFEVTATYGDYGFEPFEGGCPRIIMVGQRSV